MFVVGFQHLGATVRRSSVDDDELEVSERLVDDALDGPLQTFPIVVVDGYDGVFHFFLMVLILLRMSFEPLAKSRVVVRS